VWEYYRVDIQDGIHSSLKDAIYTMKIFKEKYPNEKYNKNMRTTDSNIYDENFCNYKSFFKEKDKNK
jgi:uncharacterized protein YijF (DUF1287 family)